MAAPSAATQTQTNGATRATAPVVLPGPSNATRAQARIRESRAATLAELESGPDLEAKTTSTTASPAKKPAPKAEEPAEETPDVETADPDVETPDADASTDGAGDAEVTAAEEVTADPEQNKRLEAIQNAEKRSREKITALRAEARAELETERKKLEADWGPRLKAAQDFEELKKSAKRGSSHFVAAMRALGLGEDDFEPAAQVLYAFSKAGAADPARKAHAERLMRDRDLDESTSSAHRRIEELEAKLEQKDQQAQIASQRSAYLDHAVKAIGEDAPLAKALAAKNPAKLREALWATTERLYRENDNEIPEPAALIAAYEKTRRAELEELGVDVPTLSTTKKNNQAADKKHPAKTLGNDLSTPRVPRPTKSDKEHRAETLAMLESGRLE